MRGQDTYIYDIDGNTIGIINAGRFEYVPIEEISLNLKNLYFCQEDKRFKEHCDVDFISTARAATSGSGCTSGTSRASGSVSAGGSGWDNHFWKT
ncbi:transglycosylase domain-containing protein [Tissierella praeacuta]|uniref:transglycosylase domain-containing protein n=1 Tax=Tissierella praeacuta TaxID=43131 RepID=UPI00333E475A